MGNTAEHIVGAVDNGSAPLAIDPVVGAVEFLPRTWDEVRVGDELISLSGTSRLALSIAELPDRQLQFDFLTTKAGREPQRESLRSNRLLVSNLRSVRRTCRDTVTPVRPKHWSELRCGDLLLMQDGSRKLVTGISAIGSDREIHTLTRARTGALQFETARAAQTKLSDVAVVERYEQAPLGSTANLPPPPGETGSLPLSVIQNIEALLGRGELGDALMMAFWKLLPSSTGDAQGISEVDIAFEINATHGEFVQFDTTLQPTNAADQGFLRIQDDGSSPSVFSALVRPRAMLPELAALLRRSLFLANLLRGVGSLDAPRAYT